MARQASSPWLASVHEAQCMKRHTQPMLARPDRSMPSAPSSQWAYDILTFLAGASQSRKAFFRRVRHGSMPRAA